MRDIFVTGVVFASLPLILMRPWTGILMWSWMSYMNPHKLTWGFAYDMPFALIVAVTTLVAVLLSSELKKLPWTAETGLLVAFLLWMSVTTLTAHYPELAWRQLDKVAKIFLMTFVTLMVINTPKRLDALLGVIALSIGFYGIKGGIFTIATGGAYRVYGPASTFIGGNNEVALALIMVIPLMRYLQLRAANALVSTGLGAAIVLSAIAAIGSQSRGALLAISVMTAFLVAKSRGKLFTLLLVAVSGLLILSVMPDSWYERMNTILAYEKDASAMGRVNAWWVAWGIAAARPLVGGGFETFQPLQFEMYAPVPDAVRDVHSIYFEVLGEHGFVGLALFLLVALYAWRGTVRIGKAVKYHSELKSFADLARLLQASLIGYAAGGAFLGLAYFDLYYHLVAVIVIAKLLVARELSLRAESRGPAQPARPARWPAVAPVLPVAAPQRQSHG